MSAKLHNVEVAGYSLIASGGFSNWVDRARFDGSVVDFMNMGLGSLRTGVFNHVTVKPPVTISASQAKAKITSALVRNAQLDANRITVNVEGSEVTLTGAVSSWAERRQAEHAAWAAPGVTSVQNRITVNG